MGLGLSMKNVGVVGWCVIEILTTHLPSTTLEHYCYMSPLSTVDKNEVSFHHNRGKYTKIKG